MKKWSTKRWLALLVALTGMLCVYIGQNYLDFYSCIILWERPRPLNYDVDMQVVHWPSFVFNKTLRYLFNDLFAILLLFALFNKRSYIRFSFWVMLFGLLILHPAYLCLMWWRPEGFSSAISHLHRIIMNPALILALIPAFYFQSRHSAHRP